MSVSNGQEANQTTFNNAFASKSAANTYTGVQTLSNTASESGDSVSNVQREFNAVWSFVGGSLDQSKDYAPTWTNTNAGASDATIVEKVEAIDLAVGDINSTLAANTFAWNKYDFSFESVTAAASANSVFMFELGVKQLIQGIVVQHTEPFAGGSITDVTIDVGPTGSDVTKYVELYNVNSATGSFLSYQLFDLESISSASDVGVRFKSTGDDLDALTGGSVTLWVLTSTLV